jgi:Na+/H+ antiporter NhaC
LVDKPALSVSDTTAISMPVRNLLSIVVAVCIGVWSYFGIVERLNRLETFEKLIQKDLTSHINALNVDIEKNNEFRIKWPRGE